MFVYKEEWNAKCGPNPEINYAISIGAKLWIWINVFNKKFDNFFDIGWIENFLLVLTWNDYLYHFFISY